ncbi:MAG: hypothetical protein ABJM26_15310 [Anderseniella sp.]
MKRFFHMYQYLGPVLLGPLAVWGWHVHYDGNWYLVGVALTVPIAHAYIVPGIGTNVLKMWSFNSKLKLGRFRPHHGFVFGSATSIIVLALMTTPAPAPSAADIIWTAVVCGTVLLLINWVYDALAIKSGYLEVYNQVWSEGGSHWAIAGDYVVWFFGLFGVIYGLGLRFAETILLNEPTAPRAAMAIAATVIATITLPTLAYILTSWIKYRHYGLRPFAYAEKQGEMA